jgi:putative (di)nucleoside polyphosphate hydrolase
MLLRQHIRLHLPRVARRTAAPTPLACLPRLQSTVAVLPPELSEFRPNVGVCLVNDEGLVFAATRVDDPGRSWQMPQGGIDAGEAPLQAALRELAEETSVVSVEPLAELPVWLTYEFPTHVRCTFSGEWAAYKGQAQRWFLLRFTGSDAEINLKTAHREFNHWRWMPLEQLPGSVISFKQDVYARVAQEFGPIIQRTLAARQ